MAELVKLAKICDSNKTEEFNILFSQHSFSNRQINDSVEVQQLDSNNKYTCPKSTCINIASQYSSVHIVETLLKNGAQSDLTNGNKDTPLHSACRSRIDAPAKVELLIKHDPELLNKENKSHLTPLHLAVLSKDETLCDILLLAGADVGALSRQMLTPLHIACHSNRKRCVEHLLKHPDIDLNIQDIQGDTPLHHCASKGHLTIVQMLKNHPKCLPYLTNKKGFKADEENPMNKMLLKESADGSTANVKKLIQCGAVCITDRCNETPMHKACRSRKKQALEKVRLLHDLEPNQLYMRNKAGLLPVHIAVHNRRLLEFFASKGCINSETLRKRTPLSLAAYLRLEASVEFLLSQPNCDVNAQDSNKNTPAHLAASQNHDAILSAIQAHPKYRFTILNKAGKTADDIKYELLGSIFKKMCLHAPVDTVCRMLLTGTRLTVDAKGNTDLHIACSSSVDAVQKCKVILQTDPNVINTKNDAGDMALHIACRGNNPELVQLLQSQPNVEANTTNAQEWTPLHECVIPNHIENVKALVSNQNVDLNMLGNGYTACHLAASFHRREIMALIQSQPRFSCNVLSGGGQTVAQMWSTHGMLSDLIQTKWRHHQSRKIDSFKHFFRTCTLIQGHLFWCGGRSDIHVLDLELEEVRRIPAGIMGLVVAVSELADGDLVAAADTGLYHLSRTGDVRVQVSAGPYSIVTCHSGRVYAANRDDRTIEIYSHSADTWWGLRRIQLPTLPGSITLWVNNYNIHASVWNDDTIYVYDHEGSLLSKHGGLGEGAGQFMGPLICHGDDEGHVLIADCNNRRMQVLHSDGHCSLIDIPGLEFPISAVYTPGRLYIIDYDYSILASSPFRISVYLPENLNP